MLVLTILMLPLWFALAGLAIDVGYLHWVQAGMQAAADMGALAAVQNVDLAALAEGDPQIIAETALLDARTWARANLADHPATAAFSTGAVVQVWVRNGKPDTPLIHPRTGRLLVDPTVAVEIELVARGFFLRQVLGDIPLRARADASVMGRKR